MRYQDLPIKHLHLNQTRQKVSSIYHHEQIVDFVFIFVSYYQLVFRTFLWLSGIQMINSCLVFSAILESLDFNLYTIFIDIFQRSGCRSSRNCGGTTPFCLPIDNPLCHLASKDN